MDSTTWFNGGKFGTVYSFEDDKFKQFEGIRKIMKSGDKIENLKTLYNYKDRILEGARAFVAVEKFITEYWKQRGRVFEE